MNAANQPEPDDDDLVDQYLDDASRLVQEGRLTEAFDLMRKAQALAPDDAAVEFGLGSIHLHLQHHGEAVACLERAIALDPDSAYAHYYLGIARQSVDRFDAAIEALRRAVALDPNLSDAHERLGDLLTARQQHRDAAACFRRAAAGLPGTTAGRIAQAKALIAERRMPEAEQTLRAIIAGDPGSWMALWMLGDILAQAGRFEAAIPCFDRALALNPRFIGTYTRLVASKKITPADQSLVDRMRALVTTEGLTATERMTLHFSLGKAHEDLADYASAMRHFDAANAIRRGPNRIDRTRVEAWVDQLIGCFTPAYFARHASLGSRDETPLFILGMPRSGTTLIEQIVSSHPDVAAGGELTFWGIRGPALHRAGLATIGRDTAATLIADYQAVLRGTAPNAPRVTDKRPMNFEWIGLIHTLFPNARIIHCRRDPLDTCISMYCTQLNALGSFESDKGDLAFYYRQYERLMAHWRSVLPPDRLLEVDYEGFVADQDAWTRQLIAFCGLDWNDACLHYQANTNPVQTVSLWQVRQPLYRSSVQRWRRYEPWLGELRTLLPDGRSESA